MRPAHAPTSSWQSRLRDWFRRIIGLHQPAAPAPYPDYVACPHCGEPEVEVWCYETEARCHNCGQTFAHALPPDCEPACGDCGPDHGT